MAINTTVYGDEASWVRIFDGDLPLSDALMRSPYFNQDIISNGFNKVGDPIDTSFCFSGLGTESVLCHLNIYGGSSRELVSSEDWDEMPWAFGYNNFHSSPNTFELDAFNEYNMPSLIYSPLINASLSYDFRETENHRFFTRIPYKRFVLAPVIIATSDLDGTDYYQGDLDGYMSKYDGVHFNYEKYKYIRSVKLLWFLQENENEDREDITGSFYSFIYNCAPWNTWQGKTFFEKTVGEVYSYAYGFCHGGYYGGIYLYGAIYNQGASRITTYSDYVGVPVTSNFTVDENGYVYMLYYNGFQDDLMKDMACFGTLFTTSSTKARTLAPNAQGMFMGVLDENWVGHGEYVEGTEIEDLDQYKNGNTDKNEYDPSGGGGGEYDEKTKSHKFTGTTYSLNTIYIDPAALGREDALDVAALIRAARAIPEDEVEKAGMYGQDPSQRLVRAWRLFAKDTKNSYAKDTFKIGEYDTGAYAYHTQQSTPMNFDCGTVKIGRIHKNFLDFEPYTSIRIYVPFCGSIELPPSLAMGQKVSLEESIHPHTGDIVANVYIGGIFYDAIKGNCSEEIGLNAEQSATFALAQHQYKYQALNGVIKTANAVAGGIAGSSIAASYGNTTGTYSQAISGALGAASGALEVGNNMYLAEHSAPAIQQVTTSSPSVQYANITEPYVMILSPEMLYNNEQLEKYKKVRGVPLAEARKLNECSGFTQCSEIVLDGIDATSTEKEMIREMLRKGVIL